MRRRPSGAPGPARAPPRLVVDESGRTGPRRPAPRHHARSGEPHSSLPFPSLPFPSLPFPSLPFPSLPFPSLLPRLWILTTKQASCGSVAVGQGRLLMTCSSKLGAGLGSTDEAALTQPASRIVIAPLHRQPSGRTVRAVATHPAAAATLTLPRPRRRARTVPDRACMAAILFMARASTPWALLPVGEFGCGSVTTCWRRFAEWAHAGCSSGCRTSCWTSSARPTSSTGPASAWTPSACAPPGGPHRRKPGRPGQAWIQAAPGR